MSEMLKCWKFMPPVFHYLPWPTLLTQLSGCRTSLYRDFCCIDLESLLTNSRYADPRVDPTLLVIPIDGSCPLELRIFSMPALWPSCTPQDPTISVMSQNLFGAIRPSVHFNRTLRNDEMLFRRTRHPAHKPATFFTSLPGTT
jgi:hypothetical protein